LIWLVLALIGAGSFFVTGFHLLTDPLCVSADFGGGRVVQVTCRSDEFGTVTGLQAGLISILIGLGILSLLFWSPIKALFVRNKQLKEANNKMSEDNPKLEPGTTQSNFTINSSGVPTKRCPNCAEDIKIEAIKCRFCGSDLGPKGIEKTNLILENFLKKYPPRNHVFEMMALTLVLTAIGILIFNYTTKSRELNALKESGQICVVNDDGTGNYGCADYPKISFKICGKNEFINWTVRNEDLDYLNENYIIIQGQRSLACRADTNPYLFEVNDRLEADTRLGEYTIWGAHYDALSGGNYLEVGDYRIMARVYLEP